MEDPNIPIASRIREAQTPAQELRRTLARLEGHMPQIGNGDRAQAAEILALLDKADALIEEITAHGADLGPELSRFQTVTQQLDRKMGAFLRQIGGAEKLARLRAGQDPPSRRPWWYIDRRLAAQQKSQRQKLLLTGGIAVAVLALLGGLYALFLAPDEATRERYRYEQDAETSLMGGDYAEALAQAEVGLSYAPGDPELLVLKGALLELLDQKTEAELVFEQAKASYDDAEAFLSERGQVYMVANRPDLARDDADALIQINADSAIGYLQRGNANAALGDVSQAIEDLETASELAAAAGQTELQGLARIQLANLMMRMSAPQIEEPTPEP
jgi:tetratricopeptide (TPR) repeat protein